MDLKTLDNFIINKYNSTKSGAQQNIIPLKTSVDFTTKRKKEKIVPIHHRIASIDIKLNSNVDDFIVKSKSDIKFNEDYVSKLLKKSLRAVN